MAKNSTAAEVRAWAVEQGLPVKSGEGVRGRLPKAVTEAFNAAHPRAKYATAKALPEHKVEVKVKPESGKGRTVTKRVNPAKARAFAKANGHAVGSKGRLSTEALVAYARSL